MENAMGSLVKKKKHHLIPVLNEMKVQRGADEIYSENIAIKRMTRNVVKTGDDSMVIPFVAAIAISVAAAAFIIYRRMRRK